MRLFFFSFLLLQFCLLLTGCQEQSRQEQVADSPAASGADATEPDAPDYSGRLYSSGLSKQEAEKLGLSWPVYQLSGKESYFFSGPDSLGTYMGHCMGLQASEKWSPATERINGQFTYQRGALEVSGLVLLTSGKACDSGLADGGQVSPLGGLETYKGYLHRQKRPAPDIAYDYALKLEEPFFEENHPIEGRKWVKELPLFVGREADIKKIEAALTADEKVAVEGKKEQGYAESTVLSVASIAVMQ